MLPMEGGVFVLGFFIFLIMLLHVLLDCMCTLCCLFPGLFRQPYLATLYVSIFRETVNNENATLGRVMAYWAAAMSLVRALALLFLSIDLFVAVIVMYVLEGLVAEYEGFSSSTIKRKTARLISCFSFGFALLIVAFLYALHSLRSS